MSQYTTSLRGGRTTPRAGFQLVVLKWPVGLVGALWQISLTHTLGMSYQSGRKSSDGGASASVADFEKKGSCQDGIPDVLQSTISLTSS